MFTFHKKDASKSILNTLLDFGGTEEHKSKFREEYKNRTQVIKHYRDLYQTDADFFDFCFGKKPKGNIQIIAGEITLHIRCYKIDDYILAYSFGKVRGEVEKLSNEKIEWYANTVSAALSRVSTSELNHCVTIENISRNLEVSKPQHKETIQEIETRKIEYSERARIHEEQHQLNKLFTSLSKDPNMLSGLWDEVLALYRGGRNNSEKIYKSLTEKSGVYEYYFRQEYGEEIAKEQMKVNLKKWLYSITILEQKGYSSDEILAILYWHSIECWEEISMATLQK